VEELADAPEDQVLKLWQGLGYYSRARNLHKAAKFIAHELNGRFPDRYDDILKLPGVGPYTAAAIASIVFGEEKAVVDGNVIRVISRLFGISAPVDLPATRKEIEGIASLLIKGQNPSDFNQAIMEFGALQCTPKQAQCQVCKLKAHCWAFHNAAVETLPKKSKKVKRRTRYFHFVIAHTPADLLLERRGDGDIWGGLYQFPLIETADDRELLTEEIQSKLELEGQVTRVNKAQKHVLSHQDLHARFYHMKSRALNTAKFMLVSAAELHTFALPRLIDRYLENYDLQTGKKRH
jgi:A/G-specific adenine glycosylase